MRTILRVTLLALASTTLLAAAACSNSDEETPKIEEPTNDAGSNTSIGEASTPDAATDAATDADSDADVDVDAGPRECSDGDFCHTALPGKENLRGVWGDGTGVVWAVSDTGHVLRWDGTKWSLHVAVLDASFTGVTGTSPTDIWLVGTTGVFHGTGATSAAVTFTRETVPGDTTVPLTAIFATAANDVWAIGGWQSMANGAYPYPAKGRVAHFTGTVEAGGNGWELSDAPADTAYTRIWGTPKTGVWITGTIAALPANGYSVMTVVRRREAGSTTWTEVPMPPDPTSAQYSKPNVITGAGSSSDSTMWMAGYTQNYNQVYYRGTSTDDGVTFTWELDTRKSWDLSISGFWGLAANDTWAVGDYGRLRHWDGTDWEQAAIMVTSAPVKNALYGIWGKNNDDFWVVGDAIALHKTNAARP